MLSYKANFKTKVILAMRTNMRVLHGSFCVTVACKRQSKMDRWMWLELWTFAGGITGARVGKVAGYFVNGWRSSHRQCTRLNPSLHLTSLTTIACEKNQERKRKQESMNADCAWYGLYSWGRRLTTERKKGERRTKTKQRELHKLPSWLLSLPFSFFSSRRYNAGFGWFLSVRNNHCSRRCHHHHHRHHRLPGGSTMLHWQADSYIAAN